MRSVELMALSNGRQTLGRLSRGEGTGEGEMPSRTGMSPRMIVPRQRHDASKSNLFLELDTIRWTVIDMKTTVTKGRL